MIQLQILSGKQAGQEIVARRFPFVLGRTPADVALNDAGVWERHLEVDFQRGTGVVFTARLDAPVLLNGEPTTGGMLRNGDTLHVGAVQLRVWLTRTEQFSLGWREALTWSGLVALIIAQAAIVVLLLS